jgi:hypothetical protein
MEFLALGKYFVERRMRSAGHLSPGDSRSASTSPESASLPFLMALVRIHAVVALRARYRTPTYTVPATDVPAPPSDRFVPDDFVVPRSLAGRGFRLEPLGPQHNESDHRAWMSSIDHIRSTPGFPDGGWPPPGGISLAENLRDLQRHADDFERRVGFTYTVLDEADGVIGCVYIYPQRSNSRGAHVQSWVSAHCAELDLVLHDAVSHWLATAWPFTDIRYRDGD